jgi:hypothetical protein
MYKSYIDRQYIVYFSSFFFFYKYLLNDILMTADIFLHYRQKLYR